MANAGRVAIVPKGEYSATVAYKRLDLVRYQNDLYVAKKANTGVAPTDSETWMLSLENVSQTQYDDLINGTTPAGNSKLLNGLTAKEVGASGVSNLIPYPYHEDTVTRSGITFTNNKNGTVTINGTSTASTYFNFIKHTEEILFLLAGTYTISGGTEESKWDTYNIRVYHVYPGENDSLITWTLGKSRTFTLTENAWVYVQIGVAAGVTVNNVTLYPMLELGTIAHDFVPYHFGGAEDAAKLNGLTAEEFARNKDFHRSDTYTYMESGTGEELYRLQLQSGEVKVWKSTDNGTTWTDLGSVSDGGNADTVGGLHASEFARFIGTIDTATFNDPSPTVPYFAHISNVTAEEVGLPSSRAEDYYRVMYLPDASSGNATEIAFHVNNKCAKYRNYYGGWKEWKNFGDGVFLPLDGSVPMSGNLAITHSNGDVNLKVTNTSTDKAVSLESSASGRIGLFDYKDEQWIFVKDIDGIVKASDVTGAFMPILHTGNSQKVVTSASAPSDTSALWVDTTNKKVKAYIDGAWTAMA